jgi:hypothetical protein
MADANRSVHPNALPNYEKAFIPPEKLEKYALDPTHPTGRHKAIVFKRALGIDQSNWEALRQAILDALPYHEAVPTKEDIYGKRYKVVLPIKGPNGDTKEVVVTWIIKSGTDSPRLDSTWVR